MTNTAAETALANVGRSEVPKNAVDVVNMMRPEIQRALPKGLDADRIARLALTLIKRDMNLRDSTPESFAGALLTASALGLEPGLNNEAHLVAYKGECTLIIGYGGMTKLFWQSPLAEHIDAQAVFENDDFEYQYGLDPVLKHTPARGDRGNVTHFYAVAKIKGGGRTFTVLTAEDAKKLRGGKVGPDSRFKGGDPMHWMERKTALRQLFKLLPKSTNLAQAISAEDKSGSQLHAELTARREIEAAIPAHDPDTGEVLEGELVDDPNSQWNEA